MVRSPKSPGMLFLGTCNLVRCGLVLRREGSENLSFTVSFKCLLPVSLFLSVMCKKSWFHGCFTRACQALELRTEYHKVLGKAQKVFLLT